MAGGSYLRRAVENLRNGNTGTVREASVPDVEIEEQGELENGNGNITVDVDVYRDRARVSALALREMYMSGSDGSRLISAQCTPSPHETDREDEGVDQDGERDDSYIIVEEGNAEADEDEGDVQTFYLCPICRSMVFPSLEEVETHQETCSGEEVEEEEREEKTNASESNGISMGEQGVPESARFGKDDCSNTAMIELAANDEGDDNSNNVIAGTIPLGLAEDSAHLIPLHCFVRKYCLHIFSANRIDAHGRKIGKGKPITVGQVGICCPHCISLLPRTQARGAIYFPSNIAQIYSAALNLLQRHVYSCVTMPHDLKDMYERLKSDEGRSGRSKHYWIESATKLGLVDTDQGIRYIPPQPHATPSQQLLQHQNHLPSPPNHLLQKQNLQLVLPQDKEFTTDYAMFLYQQMERCTFSESDKIGKRRGCAIGFAGMACTHCSARCGLGRLFPTSFKSFADTSKTMDKMHIHLLKCRDCPIEVKSTLIQLKHQHDTHKTKLKFGLMKAFHVRVWARLHGLDEATIVDGRNIQAAMGLSALSR